MNALPPEPMLLMPVTAECVVSAANQYQVHPALLLSILSVERGGLGGVSVNDNKTVDLGPMQINSVHLGALKPFGITAEKLKNDGCLNVHIGAYLLKTHERDLGGNAVGKNTWQAVAHYHSKTPSKGQVYASKVAKAYASLPESWKSFNCQTYNACQIKVQYQNGVQVAWYGINERGGSTGSQNGMYAAAGQTVAMMPVQSQYEGQVGQTSASVVQLAPYTANRKR